MDIRLCRLVVAMSGAALMISTALGVDAADNSRRLAQIERDLESLDRNRLKIHANLKRQWCEIEAGVMELSFDRERANQFRDVAVEAYRGTRAIMVKELERIDAKEASLRNERRALGGS
jgi:hypothetical protein